MSLDTFIIIVCAVLALGSYIYLRATGAMWNYINWKAVAKAIAKLFR